MSNQYRNAPYQCQQFQIVRFVERDRSNTCDAAPPGETHATNAVTGKKSTGKVTWADVVKGRVVVNENEEKLKNGKIVSSALSRTIQLVRTEVKLTSVYYQH